MVLGVLSRLMLAMPLALAVLYGMAWWANKAGKPSLRAWSIAASLAMILLSVPLSIAACFILTYSSSATSMGFLCFTGLVLALGISGLVAFGGPGARNGTPLTSGKPPRLAGDGTSALIDKVAFLLAIAGYCAGGFEWDRWGNAHHLHLTRGYLYWLLFVSAMLIDTAMHELGHTTAGIALGMKLRAFIVGPFQWRVRDGRWKFQFVLSKIISAGGATAVVPTNPRQSRLHTVYMIAAGPLTSLCTGLIAMAAALTAKGSPYEPAWQWFAFIATFGLVSFAVNLVPVRPDALYSDGARIYQLLSGGPWADLHQALSFVGSTTVTPLRPRDYDIEAIQRAAGSFTRGRQALLLRLLASYYFLDSRQVSKACDALADAESIYLESASDIPAELHTDFIFGSAFLRRDAASARLWWDRMETTKPTHFGADYWLARSALLWVENDRNQAREAWEKGNTLAQQLPGAGTYEFERYRYVLVRKVLDAVPPVDLNEPALALAATR
jgi:hypothetical protein